MTTRAFRVAVVLVLISCWAASPGLAQDRQAGYPPELPGAAVETYKIVGDVELRVWIYSPDGHRTSDRRPAIVFFFGGGWRQGTPAQFAPHCQYLASRGMVAITADYRVANRHGVKIFQCVEDAKSAVRWIRANAPRLGVDAERVAVGGGSAGGHLAAATAIVPGFDAAGEDTSRSAVPNALVLFNPAVVLARIAGVQPPPADAIARLTARAGVDPKRISPYHHVDRGAPPTIIFHGEADETVPYETVVAFCDQMKRLEDSCQLVGYEGAAHGFFNYGREGGEAYVDTVRRADEFLTSLGFLEGEPTIGIADPR
jgi:acetyl esterase/lipase